MTDGSVAFFDGYSQISGSETRNAGNPGRLCLAAGNCTIPPRRTCPSSGPSHLVMSKTPAILTAAIAASSAAGYVPHFSVNISTKG